MYAMFFMADAIARRLQMQERLTEQLADALDETTHARGVHVVLECAHMCMCSRGVKQTGALTLTVASRGAFVTEEISCTPRLSGEDI